jgi:hypothetical protein
MAREYCTAQAARVQSPHWLRKIWMLQIEFQPIKWQQHEHRLVKICLLIRSWQSVLYSSTIDGDVFAVEGTNQNITCCCRLLKLRKILSCTADSVGIPYVFCPRARWSASNCKVPFTGSTIHSTVLNISSVIYVKNLETAAKTKTSTESKLLSI